MKTVPQIIKKRVDPCKPATALASQDRHLLQHRHRHNHPKLLFFLTVYVLRNPKPKKTKKTFYQSNFWGVNTEIKLLINPRLCWLHRPPHPAHHQKAPAPPEKKFWEEFEKTMCSNHDFLIWWVWSMKGTTLACKSSSSSSLCESRRLRPGIASCRNCLLSLNHYYSFEDFQRWVLFPTIWRLPKWEITKAMGSLLKAFQIGCFG